MFYTLFFFCATQATNGEFKSELIIKQQPVHTTQTHSGGNIMYCTVNVSHSALM